MADPTSTPMNVTIVSSSATTKGEKVKVTNLTRSGVIYGEFDSNKGCIINPKDNGYTAWVKGDSLIAEVHGRLQGNATGTLDTKGVKITITTAADTSSAAVDL